MCAGRVGARRGGSQNPEKVGPEGWAQNFALFFPLPPPISFFLLSLEGLLVEFWWCLKRRGAQMCAFGVLGLLCEAPTATKPPMSQLVWFFFLFDKLTDIMIEN